MIVCDEIKQKQPQGRKTIFETLLLPAKILSPVARQVPTKSGTSWKNSGHSGDKVRFRWDSKGGNELKASREGTNFSTLAPPEWKTPAPPGLRKGLHVTHMKVLHLYESPKIPPIISHVVLLAWEHLQKLAVKKKLIFANCVAISHFAKQTCFGQALEANRKRCPKQCKFAST